MLYARIEHETESGVYRSDDGGASWRKMSNTNPRPMYFSQIRIDPKTDSRIYVLGVSLHVSDDGGKTFRDDGARNIHVDHHAMWINPNNPNHIIIGNDGGVEHLLRSRGDVGLDEQPAVRRSPTTSRYDMQTPYHVCAGLQDNNTWCGPSAVRTNSGIGNDDWYVISGGDGFQPLMDPTDPRIVYGESQDGRMSRVDRVTNERKTIRPEPADGEAGARWNWDTAMHAVAARSGDDLRRRESLFRSTDRGHSWKAISPDLTTDTDRDDARDHGRRRTRTSRSPSTTASTSFGNLVTFAESPVKAGHPLDRIGRRRRQRVARHGGRPGPT